MSGQVVLSTWHLQPDISLQYAIRTPSPTTTTPTPSSVFVHMEEAVEVLTSVGGVARAKAPNFQHTWTVLLQGETVAFCPLAEFVYHAALKSSGKKFRRVWEGVLAALVTSLRSSGSERVLEYLEVAPALGEGETGALVEQVGKVKEVDEVEHVDKVEQVDEGKEWEEWDYMGGLEEEEAKVEVKMEDEEDEAEDEEKMVPEVEQTSWDEDEWREPVQKKRKVKEEKASSGTPSKLGLLHTLHERQPDAQGTFACSLALCELRFDRFLSLVDHERTHAEAFICILCGECCGAADRLIGHMDSQHAAKSEFVCRVCGFFSRRGDSLRTHVQEQHMAGAVVHQCELCPFTTEKRQSLHHHRRTMHSDVRHFCDICGKTYASAPSLYVHKKSHEPDFKKFACSVCPAKFGYSSGLSYHMAVHTGEKPFACAQCGAAFGSHTALCRHTKVVHAEEKDMVFQCEHCGKKFAKRMSREYADHIKIHTGERDHVCTICGSSYYSRKMLRKHELKKHPQVLPKRPTPVRIDPGSVPQLTPGSKAATCTFS